MSIEIFPHLDLESLIEGLEPGDFTAGDLPIPIPVIVPSVSFADEMRRRIASRQGVCMGQDWQTSQTFLARIFTGVASEFWQRKQLRWTILPKIDALIASGIFPPNCLTLREKFAVADSLADRLEQYGYWRPEMLDAWAKDQAVKFRVRPQEMAKAEAWQRKFFRSLGDLETHPAVQIRRRREDRQFLDKTAERFPRILLIGSGNLNPLLLELLGDLAEAGSKITLHLLLPSLGYLGDLFRRRQVPTEAELPETFADPGAHPLLETLGQQAIGEFILLEKLNLDYSHWPEWTQTGSPPATSLLARLQHDIRSLQNPKKQRQPADDSSVRIHSCFGIRRELECLRDELLRAFTELPDLQPHEVLIAAPSLEPYGEAAAAFLNEAGLPVRLTERPATTADPVLEALLALLEMVHRGRFAAAELVEFLRLRAVRQKLEFTDEGFWDESVVEEWLFAAGLTHGLGDELPVPHGSWRFALDRLLGGFWLGPDTAQTYPGGGENFVLPVTGGPLADSQKMDLFLSWWAELRMALLSWNLPTFPAEWAQRWEVLATRLLARDADDLAALAPHLAFLRVRPTNLEVDAGTLADWLTHEIMPDEGRVLITGQITFGRLRQLQNLPCRVFAIVGMKAGNFPGQQRLPSWDLLSGNPSWWDRHPVRDDRQLFLDALLTARERVIITAPNRDPRSGKAEPFSSCVELLQKTLEQMGAEPGQLLVEHALQPYRLDYFLPDSSLPRSFDRVAAEVCQTRQAATVKSPEPFCSSSISSPLPQNSQTLSAAVLAGFLKNPARSFLRALGIRLEESQPGAEAWERSPLELDNLALWEAKRCYIEACLPTGTPSKHLLARLQADRALPLGVLGRQQWEQIHRECQPLVASLQAQWDDALSVQLPVNARFQLEARLQLCRDKQALLAWTPGSFKEPKHFLEPWIEQLLAVAAGISKPILLYSPEAPEGKSYAPTLDQAASLSLLETLLTAYEAGRSQPLPFAPQTSEILVKNPDQTPEQALAAAQREWTKQSDYGSTGEGLAPEAQLAWRDRDPWGDPESWFHWAKAISSPLLAWKKL